MANNPNARENLNPPFDSESGRENQKKSVRARKKNKTVREAMDYFLNKRVTDPEQLAAIEEAGLPLSKRPTYKEYIIAAIMQRVIEKGRMRDLLDLQQLLGEYRGNNADAEIEDSEAYFAAAEIEDLDDVDAEIYGNEKPGSDTE